MRLWAATFGDTEQYVSLVFDSYFNETLSAKAGDESLTSALMGVPYEFKNDRATLRGLYLCGLATVPQGRRRGLMTGLLQEIDYRAREMGYDFTFLLPQSDELRAYYRARGYKDGFYCSLNHYVPGHKFGPEDTGVAVERLEETETKEILDYLLEAQELSRNGSELFTLYHSRRDWEVVLREASISNEPVFVARANGIVKGVLFMAEMDSDIHENVHVKKILAENAETADALLAEVGRRWPERGITVCSSPYDSAASAYSYGMVRIFNVHDILEKIGCTDKKMFEGYTGNEIIDVILRHPHYRGAEDELKELLHYPRLELSAALLLE